jgi:hypothetical protein
LFIWVSSGAHHLDAVGDVDEGNAAVHPVDALVIARASEPDPTFGNSEAKTTLKWRVHRAWRASLLLGGVPPFGQGWILTGNWSKGSQRLGSLTGVGRESMVFRPFFT